METEEQVEALDRLSNREFVRIMNLYMEDKYPKHPNLKVYPNTEKTMERLLKGKSIWQVVQLMEKSEEYYTVEEKWVMLDNDVLQSTDDPRELNWYYKDFLEDIVVEYLAGNSSERLKKALDSHLIEM